MCCGCVWLDKWFKYSLFLHLLLTDWSFSDLLLRATTGLSLYSPPRWPTLTFQRPHFHFPVTRWDLGWREQMGRLFTRTLCFYQDRGKKNKKWCQTPAYKSDRKGSDKDTVFFFYLMGSDIQCVDKRLKPLYCTLYHEMTRWRRAEYLFTKLQSWADKITWTPYSTTEPSWRRF